MSWLDWLNIIVAVLLFLISIRSIVVDYSRADKSPYKLIRILFAKMRKLLQIGFWKNLGIVPRKKTYFAAMQKKCNLMKC